MICLVFIWRGMIGDLSLQSTLIMRGLAMGNCFFCVFQLGDYPSYFIQCLIAYKIRITFVSFDKLFYKFLNQGHGHILNLDTMI